MIARGDDRSALDRSAAECHRKAMEMLHRLGGEKLVRDIIDAFTTGTPPRLAAARAGAHSGDCNAVRRSLHALKSSAGQLGAAEMQRICGEGELLADKGAAAELSGLMVRLELEYARVRADLDEIRR